MATGFAAGTYTTVSTLSDLYEKTNTKVMTAIKLTTEESKWLRTFPREDIKVSGNENRIPLVLVQPGNIAMIGDGQYEAVPTTNAPTHGTFMPVQMNGRYAYTGLASAFDNRSRAAMIEEQTAYQAMQKGYAFGRTIGLQFYGQSTGTAAVVKTTGSASATQVVPLKNAFGSTLVPGGDAGAQDTYLSNIFRLNEHVALIRSGAIVEFGTVTASPSATSGIGYIDVTFSSSITPTANDLVVFANAVTDSTISGTDVNNWPVGFIEALTASSVHGVTTASFPAWVAGSAQTGSQRLSFQVKERMMNDIWNAGGVQMNRMIVAQGVRRDAIAGELGARRYDSAEMDLEGDLKGFKYLTSQLVPPGMAIGWFDQAYGKIELSDQPEDGAGKGIFKLDKVQDRSAVQASFDYFYQKIVTSRAAMGYASNLSSQ